MADTPVPAIGEMARRIQELDWARTALGPMNEWSPTLRMMVTVLLANRFPMLLWWGPEFVSLYNDAYSPILGAKHPWALGQPVSVCWQEIWSVLRPLVETPFRGGPATWMDDIELELRRHGYPEETHFTVAYSPVPDETAPGGIGGVLATVHEITDKVIAERRALALRDLGVRGVEAKSAEQACENAAAALRPYERDLPFVLLYLLEPDHQSATLASCTGVEPGHPICPKTVRLDDSGAPWPFGAALKSESLQIVDDLARKFPKLPAGPWPDPPTSATIAAVPSSLAHQFAGFVVVGLSSRNIFDDKYRNFVGLLTGQIATAVANAKAFDEEARRAAALTELDRAKTAFFSNVSHEFRTPLTLMLGPLEQAMRESEESRDTLRIAHRNSLRLLKLVNSLLDFSRIEAGRTDAVYEPTDLAALTSELASTFRDAIEKAGLRFIVQCPPLSDPVFVDRDMWEKIVFNLLSNAFKFTLDGEISLRLSAGEVGGRRGAQLEIEDTGTGVPPHELPRLFERFHRIHNSRARSQEGTGIGLALVQELARMHGGQVTVSSELNRGTKFTVSLPIGADHLPKEQVGRRRSLPRTGLGADAYVEEALRWLPDASPSTPDTPTGARIVLADDNNDMRGYVRGLLSKRGYAVYTAADGNAALELTRRVLPDLVISDVMMPNLDGFGLLQTLRSASETRAIPVILLTARAGEEARIEGAQAGADDYLTKPFSARELLARVATQLELAKIRRENSDRIEAERQRLEIAVSERTAKLRETVADLEAFSYSIAHDLRAPLRTMRCFSEVLLEEHAPRLEMDGRQLLERIAAAAGRMDRLVGDILTYSRVVRGDSPLGRVDVTAVLREVIETFPSLGPDRATIEVDLGNIEVMGNKVMLIQIFSNLLGNAVKFVAPGVRPTVRIASSLADGRVRLTVQDNGIGIAPELHEKIFEIFQQGEQGYDGTGIGLAIVKKAVERMGGSFGVNSHLGHGSEFWVELPRAEIALAATGFANAPVEIRPSGR